ncbi:MAG TPA: DUF4349 domain-containing protein [Bacillales bacterium]|nr:DUF4349 domain-containing protein [Bacillales bacterium]
MKKIACFFFSIFFALSLVACSSNGSSSKSNANKSFSPISASSGHTTGEKGAPTSQESSSSSDQATYANDSTGYSVIPKSKRMVIYNANMDITVRKFQQARNQIQSLIEQNGGYVVHSSFSETDTEKQTGTITTRIPQDKFHSFMNQIGQIAENVKQSNVQGQDVTKQYVDLNARLKAKREVRDRLNSFLQKATDSSDLLKISNQLADVQEQIEQIKGQMNYLQNHSALATVTITMTDVGAGIADHKDLNTWGKIQQAFIGSINLIMNVVSALVVFIIGYSPILIILLIIAAVVYWLYRRKRPRAGS